MTIVGFNPQESPRNAAQAKSITLGEKRWIGPRAYRFVMAVDAVDIVAGDTVEYADALFTAWEVSPDISGGSSITVAAGVAMVAVDVSSDFVYFWIQTDGPNLVAMQTDGNVAASKMVISGAANHQCGIGAADGTDIPKHMGVASAADATNTSAVGTILLRCP